MAVYKDPADGTFSGGLYVTNLTGDRIRAIVIVMANAGPSTDCPGFRLGVLSASVMLIPGDTEYVGLTSLDKYSEAPCLEVRSNTAVPVGDRRGRRGPTRGPGPRMARGRGQVAYASHVSLAALQAGNGEE